MFKLVKSKPKPVVNVTELDRIKKEKQVPSLRYNELVTDVKNKFIFCRLG